MDTRIGLSYFRELRLFCGCNAYDRGYNVTESHENPAYLATGTANFRFAGKEARLQDRKMRTALCSRGSVLIDKQM